MRSLFALRIVKPPRWVSIASANEFRPGMYCASVLFAFEGRTLDGAEFYTLPLGAAMALTEAEKRHPGMEVEIVEFLEQAETSRTLKDTVSLHERHVGEVQAFLRGGRR